MKSTDDTIKTKHKKTGRHDANSNQYDSLFVLECVHGQVERTRVEPPPSVAMQRVRLQQAGIQQQYYCSINTNSTYALPVLACEKQNKKQIMRTYQEKTQFVMKVISPIRIP